jgi:nitrate reductase NapE component
MMATSRHRAVGGLILRPMTGWQRVKVAGNFVNLTTLVGLAVGVIGRARFSRGPRGLYFANGYKLGFPIAGAFTIGNVVLSKHERTYFDDAALVRHEERHSWQYFCLLGLPLFPLYVVGVVISFLLTGDPASRNPFERLANLKDGGYAERPIQPIGKTVTQAFSVLRSRPKGP